MTYNCNVHSIITCIVFCCTHVSRFYLIFFHLEMQKINVNCIMGTICIANWPNYIKPSNTYLGFLIFLWCNVLVYYLIIKDLELQCSSNNCITYCVLLHPSVMMLILVTTHYCHMCHIIIMGDWVVVSWKS
jgi:hypothetical protein